MQEAIDFLKKILKQNDCIVIGVSGGPDSMCLFDVILKLRPIYNLKIICAHINHSQRKESEEEKEFVEKISNENNCIFAYKKLEFETTKDFENQARQKRYQFFKQVMEKYQADYLLTAHHGDDLIETILMRLTRGSNLKGYAGIKKISNFANFKIVRPFLYTTKKEIEEYNKENKIEYRIDKSNESDNYTRNRYRKQMLPFLKQENKNVHLKFLKFSEEMEIIDNYIENSLSLILTSVYDFGKVNLHKFKNLDLVLQKRVIEYILKEEYGNNINCITDKHVELILHLCNSQKANQNLNLPLKKTIIKSYETLYWSHNNKTGYEEYSLEDKVVLNDKSMIIKISETDIEKSNYILRLNSKEIQFPLKIRTRKKEDKMEVKNLQGSKKIKDIFIDEKIPIVKRDSWPILVDANDNILWLLGLKKSKFDKNNNEFYDIIYKYVISEEKQNEKK